MKLNVVSEIPCFKCKEPCHCCTEEYPDQNLIMITLHDAERITKTTGKKIEEFAEFRQVKPERREELTKDERYYMINDSALFMKKKGNKCVFLNNKYMCKIHKYRPHLCRMYPFWYDGEGDDITIVRMNSKDSDECPVTCKEKKVGERVFNKVEESRESLTDVARQYDDELYTYQKYKKDLQNSSPSKVLKLLKSGKYD